MSPRRKTSKRKPRLEDLPSSGLAADVLGESPPGASSPAPQPVGPPDPGLYTFARRLQNGAQGTPERAPEVRETWVGFTLDGGSFGLPVTHVQEIARVGSITRVPQAPAVVRGVSNIRGRVIPIVDLRRRLGLPDPDPGGQSRVLVVPWRDALIGFLVDGVERVMQIAQSEVRASDAGAGRSEVVCGVVTRNDDFTVLLDIERLLSLDPRMEAAS